MKKSEYKKELDELLMESRKLKERREMLEKNSEWLLQRSDEICKRMDNSDDLPWQEKEQLLKEAEEIAGRLSSDLRALERDKSSEELMERLDKVTIRRIKEGLEEG